MRKLLTFSLFLLLSISFFSCGADGELDEALFREYAERFQDEIMPTKEEYQKLMEKQIAAMPSGKQAEARKNLEETLADWPTDAEVDEAIDKFFKELPSRSEVDQELNKAMSEASEEGGFLGRMVKGAIEGAMKEGPSPDEVNGLIEEVLDEASHKVDSLRRAQ